MNERDFEVVSFALFFVSIFLIAGFLVGSCTGRAWGKVECLEKIHERD